MVDQFGKYRREVLRINSIVLEIAEHFTIVSGVRQISPLIVSINSTGIILEIYCTVYLAVECNFKVSLVLVLDFA